MPQLKQGLEYFPLDLYMDSDDKIVLIESRYGTEGFTVIIKLLMKIYRHSYYYDWTEKEMLLFSNKLNINEKVLNDIINDCIKWEMFNEKMFKKYKILTSKGIQDRYFKAVKRRLKVDVCKEYTLVHVFDYINNDNVNIYSLNDDIETHSTVKESTVKESKVKYMDYVLLTKEEFNKLKEKFGENKTNDYIENLNYYIGSKGKKYKSHYMTILSWSKKDNSKKTKINIDDINLED